MHTMILLTHALRSSSKIVNGSREDFFRQFELTMSSYKSILLLMRWKLIVLVHKILVNAVECDKESNLNARDWVKMFGWFSDECRKWSVNILIYNISFSCKTILFCFFFSVLLMVSICLRKIRNCLTLIQFGIYAFTRTWTHHECVTMCSCVSVSCLFTELAILKTWIMQSFSSAFSFVYYMSKILLLTYFIFTDFSAYIFIALRNYLFLSLSFCQQSLRIFMVKYFMTTNQQQHTSPLIAHQHFGEFLSINTEPKEKTMDHFPEKEKWDIVRNAVKCVCERKSSRLAIPFGCIQWNGWVQLTILIQNDKRNQFSTYFTLWHTPSKYAEIIANQWQNVKIVCGKKENKIRNIKAN